MKRFFTLLSVGDSRADQSLLQEAVIRTQTPFHIQPFFSPDPAITYLRGEPPFDNRKIYPFPALILCDDYLESSNDDSDVSDMGSGVVARIRTISSCAGLPIIMLGDPNGHDSVSRCYEAGVGHFLHKPTSPGGLGIFVQSLYACATSAPLHSTASGHRD
jgi:CheY-like chemotaxis protein